MIVEQVDPRDVVWESRQGRFRAHLWRRSSTDLDAGWTSDEYDLAQTDVRAALAWLEERRGTRDYDAYELFALVASDDGVGQVWLAGENPNG